MIAKKNPKYDLEKNRKVYFNLGLMVAGAFTLAAFKFGTPNPEKVKPVENPKLEVEQIFEVKDAPKPEKKFSSSTPTVPKILNPEKVKEVEKEPKEIIKDVEKLPEFKDFKPGGDKGGGVFEDPDPQDTLDIEFVESYPEFPGGDTEMSRFIKRKFVFPMHNYGDQGTIYVRFVVTHKGEVLDATVIRGVSPELDKEALKVVKAMPNWIPGKNRGRAVNVRMIIPIKVKYQ